MRPLIIFSIGIFWLPVVSWAGPKLAIPEKSWDFGNVSQHTTIAHAYWLKNIGDDTLRIINVKPT